VILAGAVGTVVKGFVSMIVMPIIGTFSGGVSFADKVIELAPAVLDVEGNLVAPANNLQYGAWIDTIISLIIVGFVLFMIVKVYNKTKKKVEEAPATAPAATADQELLMEIRDLLKK
jgi:large conductance mechanosensitive channel